MRQISADGDNGGILCNCEEACLTKMKVVQLYTLYTLPHYTMSEEITLFMMKLKLESKTTFPQSKGRESMLEEQEKTPAAPV